MCPWTKGCCHSLHVVVKLFPTQFTSLFSYCFINVLGDCFPPSMWGHGWVVSIFQTWEWSPYRSWLSTVETPGCLGTQLSFWKTVFNGFSVLFVDQPEKPIVYSISERLTLWCLLMKFLMNLICLHRLQFRAHVLGRSFTHCMNKVNLIILKLSKRKMLPTSTQDNAKTQTNKLKNFFCTTMIALFIQSNTVYYVWKS